MKPETPFKDGGNSDLQGPFAPFTERNAVYKPSGGWVGGTVTAKNHTRNSKVYPDATAQLEVSGGNGYGVSLDISETYETKAGERTNTTHINLTLSNTRALRDMLNQMIEAAEQERA